MGAPASQPGPGGDRPGPETARDRARSRRREGRGAAARGTRSVGRASSAGLRQTSAKGTGGVDQGGNARRMLRLLHTADVHLGARHADLGEAAAAQRERQFAAFAATVDLAIAEKVDLFLVAGDLFDSNTQPRRSVERVAAELARPGAARIRVGARPRHPRRLRPVVGLPRLRPRRASRAPPGETSCVTVLTPERPVDPHRAPRRRRPGPVLRDQARAAQPAARTSPPRGAGCDLEDRPAPRRDRDPRPDRPRRGRDHHDEIAASGLDYLALGHWHSAQAAKAGGVTYAYAGAPEPVAVDQDRAGKVLLVDARRARRARKSSRSSERAVGRTAFERRGRRRGHRSSPSRRSSTGLAGVGRPDLVLDVRLIGVRPDELDLDPGEVEEALRGVVPPAARARHRASRRSPRARCRRPRPSRARSSGTSRAGSPTSRRGRRRRDRRGRASCGTSLRLGRLLLAGHEVTL